jgi:hypothetical protein
MNRAYILITNIKQFRETISRIHKIKKLKKIMKSGIFRLKIIIKKFI